MKLKMTTTTIRMSCSMLVTGVLLSSCINTTYTYYLDNKTPYALDSAILNGDHRFSLEPGEIKGPFQGIRSSGFGLICSEPMLTLFVTQFSSADSSYHSRYGIAHHMRVIEDDGTYIFRICEPDGDSDISAFSVVIDPVTVSPPLASNHASP
jgi:hypothetical protein